MALEAVPAGHPDKHEPAVVVGVGPGQLGAHLVDAGRRHLQQLGQQSRLDRALGHHQDRLDGPGRFGGH